MKYFRYLLKSLFRNRLRSLLTISTIAAALFLIATLLTVLDTLTNPPETPQSALRLITRHKISLMNALPTNYLEKIRKIEGVDAVHGSMWFGGVYDNKGADAYLGMFAVSTEDFFDVNADMRLSDEQREAFLTDRSTALVGDQLIERYGWRLGDTVHFKSNLFPVSVELKIAAVYEDGGGGDQGNAVYFHWEYFNQALNDNGIMGTFRVRASSAQEVPRVAERIDSLFVNTTQPTKTETEKAFLLGFMEMMGNVRLLISSICLAVIFAVVLIAANTMAMSIRERIREIGILKALGFRSRQILAFLVGESLLLAVLGAFGGALGARLVFGSLDMVSLTGGMIQALNVKAVIVAGCAAIGVLIGLLAGGVPAWRASRRPVLESLRNV